MYYDHRRRVDQKGSRRRRKQRVSLKFSYHVIFRYVYNKVVVVGIYDDMNEIQI